MGLFFEKLYQQLYICLYCKDWLFNLSLISNNITLFLKRYVKFEGLFFVKLYEQLYIYLYCTFIVYRPNEDMKHVHTFKKLSENLKGFIMFSVRNISRHSRFLLSWSTKKILIRFDSVFNLDEFGKIIYDGSLSYKTNSTANSTHLAALFCPI